MLVSSVQAVVVPAPRVCTLVHFLLMCELVHHYHSAFVYYVETTIKYEAEFRNERNTFAIFQEDGTTA